MSYVTVETQVQTILQGLTSVFATSAQVTRGDWSVLDRGYDAWAVIYPGAFDERQTAIGGSSFRWMVNVEFGIRFTKTAYTDLASKRDSLLQHLQKYPTLNRVTNVNRGEMSASNLTEIFDKDGSGPFYLSQIITLPIDDFVQVTISE